MDIEKYIAEKKKKIDEALEKFLPKKDVEPKSLALAMHYSVLAGGKRIRPILTLATAEACEGEVNLVLPTACAIELIHTFTLIHDDLPAIDNSDLRRGKPSCHKAYGDATAILAGDALMPFAFGIILKNTDLKKIKGEVVMGVLEEICDAIGIQGVIGGEEMDLKLEGKETEEDEVMKMYSRKTGALIQAAVRCGAMLSKAKMAMLSDLTRFSEHLGIAFQIKDDILDVESVEVEVGKPVQEDVKKGKASYPLVVGIEKAKEKAKNEIDSAIKALERFGKNADPLRGIARYIIERNK